MRHQPSLRRLGPLALLLVLAVPAQAQGQTPDPVLTLVMRANAYHDVASFSQTNNTGQVLIGNIQALDLTGDPVSGSYGSKQQSFARGVVAPLQIGLYNRAYSYAQSSSGPYSAFADANAQAYSSTPFLIQGGGAPGSWGTLVATLTVNGAIAVDPARYDPNSHVAAEGRAAMYFWATGLNPSGCSYYTDAGCLDLTRDYQGDHLNSNNPLRSWTLNIPFRFGDWSQVQLTMWTLARSSVTATGDGGWLQHYAESDFEHTLRWGGISAVLDAQGQPVQGWNVSSLPGLDLRVAVVPEPGVWLMLLAGLAVLCGRRLRQSTRR